MEQKEKEKEKENKNKRIFTKKFFKKLLSAFVTAVISTVLIFLIAGTLGGTIFVVYIMSFMNSAEAIELTDPKENMASYVYQMDNESGEYKVIYTASEDTHEICKKTDFDELPDYVKYAFICIEDQRFYAHEGVDFKRTSAAVLNEVLRKLHLRSGKFGGSTITQQLIKNVTGHDEETWNRKMNEIFSAVKLEKKYSKDDILEAYLNNISFGEINGYNLNGIEAASLGYFGKSAGELTMAEASVLAAIPNSPYYYNPTYNEEHFENNRDRKETALYKMFELGVITSDQFEEALAEEIDLATSEGFYERHPERQNVTEVESGFKNPEILSWAADTAIFEFADFLCEQNGLEERQDGIDLFKKGGYKLYLSVDENIQSHLEETFLDRSNFPSETSDTDESVQASMAVIDYKGHILGIAGGAGEKEGNFNTNYAYTTKRQPGSTIKPLTSYGYALENNMITWSALHKDIPLPAGTASEDAWPDNYSGTPSGEVYNVSEFLANSLNTYPAWLVHEAGCDEIYNFAVNKMHLGLVPEDKKYSPLSIGGLTEGITVINLANAYLPYGNGGSWYKASIILKAENTATGELLIDNENSEGERAVSEDTAFIMNKLLQNVVENGTASAATLDNIPLAAKTGTTEDWNDITFVGLTPDCVSALWVGYPNSQNSEAIRNASSSKIWKNVIGTYLDENFKQTDFPDCPSVIRHTYCRETGLLAKGKCRTGGTGYYKDSDCAYCNKKH